MPGRCQAMGRYATVSYLCRQPIVAARGGCDIHLWMNAYPPPALLHREWADDLTPARLYALLRLRTDVFVVEQNCAYQDLDGRDLEPTTRHFWIGAEDDPQRPMACLRLLQDGVGDRKVFRIGRVCTAKDVRGRGLSRRLMAAVLADIGSAESLLEAQVPVAGLYEVFGFAAEGDVYLEDGIPHITMRRPAR